MEIIEMNTDILLHNYIYSNFTYCNMNTLSISNYVDFGLRNVIWKSQSKYHYGELYCRAHTYYNDIFKEYKKWKLMK